MFGHDDKPKDDEQHDGDNFGGTHEGGTITPAPQTDGTNDNGGWQHPGPPPADDSGDDKTESFTAGHDDTASAEQPDSANDAVSSDDTGSADVAPTGTHSNDLIDIKQDALGKLSPLIGHLDQSPDEKFRTLMMMIQASDDQSLIQQAYDTALDIDDEKTRAQALLDIVNEINYFTQNPAKAE
jgi:hypothetical protein